MMDFPANPKLIINDCMIFGVNIKRFIPQTIFSIEQIYHNIPFVGKNHDIQRGILIMNITTYYKKLIK